MKDGDGEVCLVRCFSCLFKSVVFIIAQTDYAWNFGPN